MLRCEMKPSKEAVALLERELFRLHHMKQEEPCTTGLPDGMTTEEYLALIEEEALDERQSN